MTDPKEPLPPREFPIMDDTPINTGRGYDRDQEDLYLDEVPLDQDENDWWDDLDWIGD